ncbi:GGDEF domain-containing protein [Butyrivibrio sp. INlla14]|uniref:GGDEF domain-containing protein n=1 Tax=Butyrivibrio sp. INlla14 TaxID=1520808 RepID=UPI0008761CC0|nr:GGDEF domain-containing protein [Butyrivibrio sp. INlla14]SCX85977.1 diguanylate cyclase (GGDEF) domain-containing protein [Butyrivibrio sp. INlla14]
MRKNKSSDPDFNAVKKSEIAGIIDVDSQVRREQEYYRNLSAARNIANLDVLTGIKNKKAYLDVEIELNSRIKYGEELRFAIAVFDINDLKYVNDTRGHKAGDAYIKKGCQLICRAFKHSPIFRVGGDEFVALIQGEDIDNADKIMQQFREDNGKRNESGEIVIASGLAYYEGEKEVSIVFDKADADMYLDKQKLKNSI